MTNTNNIIKQKVLYEKICDYKTEGILFFPKEDNNGLLYCVVNTGEILLTSEGSCENILNLNGQPSCLVFDSSNTMYVCDNLNASILIKQQIHDGNPHVDQILAKEFENKPFRGPTCLAHNKEENLIYFADSGSFHNASLFPKSSSVYAIDLDTKVMRPLISNLSFVSDLIYDNVKEVLYVAETFMNRILRLVQSPTGVYHCSVFYQFGGRVGPTALALDEFGYLYVARYEYVEPEMEIEVDGLVSVLSPHAVLIGELIIPKLPEITGMYISTKIKENLFFTEKNTTGILKTKLSSFSSELDKIEDIYK